MLRLVTAAERLGTRTNSLVVCGRAKIGKTSLLFTLSAPETLVLDLEAGLASVSGWHGDSVALRSWPDIINIVCLLGGPDPSRAPEEAFSAAHFEHAVEISGGIDPSRYACVFVDSITDLSRIAFHWSKSQPDAFSSRTGRQDLRGAYGLLGREVVGLLKHLQHSDKTVIFVGGLDNFTNELGREIFSLQTEGAKISSELPYIVDQVVTMSDFDYDTITNTWIHNLGKGAVRALCCQSPNPWGLPAGDRSGCLDLIEEPNLARLLFKINTS
jgi:hypothetical protein